MISLADLIAQHGEDYDADCKYHSGCHCGWHWEGADVRDLAEGRKRWAAHVARIIEGEQS